MPSASEIQRNLTGAWRMMLGRQGGLERLDISADGFWNSFYAIVVAAPPLLLGWVVFARELAVPDDLVGDRLGMIVRLAFVDLAAWLVPIAGLALVAGPAGIGSRFVHYVVASNWGSAITAWMMLPPTLIRLVAPESRGLSELVSLVLFGLILFLGWRLTNLALARGPAPATALFVGMLAGSFAVLLVFQGLFGIVPPASG
jgi:hypothetical protein